MKLIYLRGERPGDRQLLEEWAKAGKDNYFDPEVMLYPATKLLVANHDKPIAMVPVMPVMAIESLAFDPNATDLEVAASLREMVVQTTFAAQENGIGETLFFATNDRTNKLALKYGWEAMPWQAYRLRNFRLGQSSNESLQVSND